jgi:hypothetical protein
MTKREAVIAILMDLNLRIDQIESILEKVSTLQTNESTRFKVVYFIDDEEVASYTEFIALQRCK